MAPGEKQQPRFKAEAGKRKVHRAKLIGENGEISPLCANKPRVLDVRPSSKETWTTDDAATNCPACVRRLKAEGRR